VPDCRRIKHANVVFCQLQCSHVWLRQGKGDVWGRPWGWVGLREGAVDSEHGTSWGWSSHPCTKGYHPSTRFFSYVFPFTAHVLKSCCQCCKIACVLNIFFSVQVKNKPLDWDIKYAFILGPYCTVANCKHHGTCAYSRLRTVNIMVPVHTSFKIYKDNFSF
jgi:hypothetical protein